MIAFLVVAAEEEVHEDHEEKDPAERGDQWLYAEDLVGVAVRITDRAAQYVRRTLSGDRHQDHHRDQQPHPEHRDEHADREEDPLPAQIEPAQNGRVHHSV